MKDKAVEIFTINRTLVELKLRNALRERYCLCIYQSYLSGIKTYFQLSALAEHLYYQSYLSGIKTFGIGLYTTWWKSAINRTLVELKRKDYFKTRTHSYAINRTLVELKRHQG